MYTKDMLVMRIKLIALSQIRNIEDSVKKNPVAYRKDTIEYCEAIHEIIESMSMERLTRIVVPIYENYEDMGMADDAYVADSLMMIVLALYQTEMGEETIYDIGWTSYLEDYFRVHAAIA